MENTIKDLHGGSEVSSFHLANLLRRSGIEVDEWTPYNNRKYAYWYTSLLSQFWIMILLTIKLHKSRANILHIHGKYLIPPAIMVGKIMKIPTIVTVRDYIVICPVGLCLFEGVQHHSIWWLVSQEIGQFISRYHAGESILIKSLRFALILRGWLVSGWLRFWLKKADAVVAVSKYVQGVLADNGIPSQVIYNAFDTAFISNYTPQLAINNQPASTRGGQLPILFIGKPSYGKGYDLFQSLSRQKEFGKYKFIAIGGKNMRSYPETMEAIKNALVVVVPSRWPEPFGRVALEAALIGTPVVITGQGGLPEIIENDTTGVVTQPNTSSLISALRVAIAKNSLLRQKLNRSKLRLIDKFQAQPLTQHLSLYHDLLTRRVRYNRR